MGLSTVGRSMSRRPDGGLMVQAHRDSDRYRVEPILDGGFMDVRRVDRNGELIGTVSVCSTEG